MKVCFIGACGHSMQAYRYLKTRDDVTLCGFAPWSSHEKAVKSIAADVPLFENAEMMLDEIKPDLAIVSPVFALTSQAIIACAKRGIDVFSEKPIASSPEELEEVKKAVCESGIKFCAMHYLRYTPAFYHGAELVRQGAIGDVKLVTSQKSYKYGTRPEWYGDRALYGGTIPWVGIHSIDWVYHFTGKRFLSVNSRHFGNDPEMAALCQFELEGGAMASVNIDYYRPSPAETHGDDRIRCAGTKGVLEVRDNCIYLKNEKGNTVLTPKDAPELLEEFLNGNEPIAKEEIFYLTKVSLLARDSADLKVPLKIEE
ncbi:MAG: Gfo/Idh/MocA family oxidoreductase [Clostridia bacterium]|nr:Gfo/Idh/MocA family oxidoreductase [Clostridia bacterium]